MRVISGKLRHRVLKEVQSTTTRSTKDRVKESVFNALMPCAQYYCVLDLFAGSGALGIEALSRGSNHAVFVELDAGALSVLKANITNLDLKSQSTVHHENALHFIKKTSQVFELILLDPPYDLISINDVLMVISKRALLSKFGKIVVLTNHNAQIHCPDSLKITKQKTMGLTMATHIEWRNNYG